MERTPWPYTPKSPEHAVNDIIASYFVARAITVSQSAKPMSVNITSPCEG